MGKLFSWIVIIAVIYAAMRVFVLFQRKSQAAALARQRREQAEEQGRGEGQGHNQGPGARRAPTDGGEPMLACARCSVYAPASEMLTARGLHYCCVEHRDAGTG